MNAQLEGADAVDMDSGDVNPIETVREFFDAFKANPEPDLWVALVREELRESNEAAAEWIKEVCDLIYVFSGLHIACEKDGTTLDEVLERSTGLRHELAIGASLIEMGKHVFGTSTITEAFLRVHESNMSKLGDDGKPIRREDGKILKGPNYKPPYLVDLVEGLLK